MNKFALRFLLPMALAFGLLAGSAAVGAAQANTLDLTDRVAITQIRKQFAQFKSDVLDAARIATSGWPKQCLSDIYDSVAKVDTQLDHLSDLVLLSGNMINVNDEEIVNGIIGISLVFDPIILSAQRKHVNTVAGGCSNYSPSTDKAREALHLFSQTKVILDELQLKLNGEVKARSRFQ